MFNYSLAYTGSLCDKIYTTFDLLYAEMKRNLILSQWKIVCKSGNLRQLTKKNLSLVLIRQDNVVLVTCDFSTSAVIAKF